MATIISRVLSGISSLNLGYPDLFPTSTQPPTQILDPTYWSECPICATDRPLRDFPYEAITAACKHEPKICLPCVRASISAQMETKTWDTLACPLCEELLKHEDMRLFALKDDFERYGSKSSHLPCVGLLLISFD